MSTMVLNVTNQCNLACTYCYEYSADKIAQQEGKPKYMTAEVAEAAFRSSQIGGLKPAMI